MDTLRVLMHLPNERPIRYGRGKWSSNIFIRFVRSILGNIYKRIKAEILGNQKIAKRSSFEFCRWFESNKFKNTTLVQPWLTDEKNLPSMKVARTEENDLFTDELKNGVVTWERNKSPQLWRRIEAPCFVEIHLLWSKRMAACSLRNKMELNRYSDQTLKRREGEPCCGEWFRDTS